MWCVAIERMQNLSPSLKTKIDGYGAVVFRDLTRYGLHRMCIAQYQQYPDLETWLELLDENAKPLGHRYTEKIVNHVFVGYLWLYWKEQL